MPRAKLVSPTALEPRDIRAIAKVLADPRRFEILRQIAAAPCTACSDLREHCPISAATLSHHIKELESAKLIAVTRTGKFLHLALNRSVWDAYLAELQSI